MPTCLFEQAHVGAWALRGVGGVGSKFYVVGFINFVFTLCINILFCFVFYLNKVY